MALLVLAHPEFQPPAALGRAWLVSPSTASGFLEQSLVSPCAGEGVGVPRGHEELYWGFAAVQERSISPRCPGTGNGALPHMGTLSAFAVVLHAGHAVCGLFALR